MNIFSGLDIPAGATIPPPTFALLNASLEFVGEGRAQVRFVPGPHTANPTGDVQGGILAACLDDTMGPALYSLHRDAVYPTVSMSIAFLDRAVPNEVLLGSASVVKAGKRHVLVEANLVREADGMEVARASATCLVRNL